MKFRKKKERLVSRRENFITRMKSALVKRVRLNAVDDRLIKSFLSCTDYFCNSMMNYVQMGRLGRVDRPLLCDIERLAALTLIP